MTVLVQLCDAAAAAAVVESTAHRDHRHLHAAPVCTHCLCPTSPPHITHVTICSHDCQPVVCVPCPAVLTCLFCTINSFCLSNVTAIMLIVAPLENGENILS